MTRGSRRGTPSAGHEVVISDLYAMNFNPVSDRRNFVTVKDPARLRQQAEEAYAAEHRGLRPGHPGGDGQALLVRCPDPPVSPLVVRASGNPEGLGRPRIRFGRPHLWRRQVVRPGRLRRQAGHVFADHRRDRRHVYARGFERADRLDPIRSTTAFSTSRIHQ